MHRRRGRYATRPILAATVAFGPPPTLRRSLAPLLLCLRLRCGPFINHGRVADVLPVSAVCTTRLSSPTSSQRLLGIRPRARVLPFVVRLAPTLRPVSTATTPIETACHPTAPSVYNPPTASHTLRASTLLSTWMRTLVPPTRLLPCDGSAPERLFSLTRPLGCKQQRARTMPIRPLRAAPLFCRRLSMSAI